MAENENPWICIPDDRLPTICECVYSVTAIAPSNTGKKQYETIKGLSAWLRELWVKSFGDEVVVNIWTIMRRLSKHLKDYASAVQKRKGSQRKNLEEWKTKYNTMALFDLLTEGSNPNAFQENERNYYFDQLSLSRKWVLSSEVDIDYEQSRLAAAEEQRRQEFVDENEMAFMMDVDDEGNTTTTTTTTATTTATSKSSNKSQNTNYRFSVNRSGKVRTLVTGVDASTQTDDEYVPKVILREGARNFKESIKIALASSCTAANISPQQARKAFQATSEIFFGNKYYLSPEEIPSSSNNNNEPSCSKRPRTITEYEMHYTDVLPSSKTISRMKHLMALQEERNAVPAILDATPDEVLTIHYDTTTRRRLNGEWPSLILKTSSGKKYRLRSINMAVEDRANIVKLFVVTLNRLALTVNTDKKTLWEKVTALMTDSVTKNLQIENLIAATLVSNHIPLHLLCVSHTCEAFDMGNLHVPSDIEKSLSLKEKILLCMPCLRSFISTGIAHAALKVYSKLITNDGHKSSLYEEFDAELTRQSKTKKFSIFKERRFALLGYTAAATIHHREDISATLSYTNSQNQLVQACRLYNQMDYVTIVLMSIAWFTYKVTFPFLNMCELETPTKLLEILPKLQKDLHSGSMDTLDKYNVSYYFEVNKPTSPLAKVILDRFCTRAAEDLGRQRGREYGFSVEPKRATDLTQVPVDICDKLPGHNLDCERDLSIMDKIATRAAACSNRKFTGTGMSDDMTLYQSNVKSIDEETKSIAKILDGGERLWFEEQAEITKAKIAKRKENALHQGNYIHTLLSKCKQHDGPFVTIDELEGCLKKGYTDEEIKCILRHKRLYRRHTTLKAFHNNPALYKVNPMSVADMKVNLAILLGEEHKADVTEEELHFPNEDDMMKCLEQECTEEEGAMNIDGPSSNWEVEIGEPCILVWACRMVVIGTWELYARR